MRGVKAKEVESVLRLDGPARYSYFIKRVVDREVAWGLWSGGWALMVDGAGNSVFPVWPGREYAELCAVGGWSEYLAEEISLDALLSELLPKLEARAVRAGVFPTPKGTGVSIDVAALVEALRQEMKQYHE